MSNLARALDLQTEAAKILRSSIAEIIGNDEEMLHDAIEGETRLFEIIGQAVDRIAILGTNMAAIDELIKKLKERCARFEKQRDLLRAAVLTAMQQTEQRSIELPQATVSCQKVPAKVEITSEPDIPSAFWKPSDPKLDKKALFDALKNKEAVPGAQLTPEGVTLHVRLV